MPFGHQPSGNMAAKQFCDFAAQWVVPGSSAVTGRREDAPFIGSLNGA
jgi:hypothetical protein